MTNQLQNTREAGKTVILHIVSAYGVSLLKGFISIHATLTKEPKKTPYIRVNNNEIRFDSTFTWNMDNEALRKLRKENSSLKIECFHTLKLDPHEPKTLGRVIIYFKNISTNSKVDSYHLIGSKECYSLRMSVAIENLKNTEMPSTEIKSLKQTYNNTNTVNNNQNLSKEDKNTNSNKKIELDCPKSGSNVIHQIKQSTNMDKQQNLIDLDVQMKLAEFQQWENNQKKLFDKKIRKKEEQLLKEFNKTWSVDRKRMEQELAEEISKCKAIIESMDKINNELKERELLITSRELEIFNSPCINDLNNKITELEKINFLLTIENEKLKNKLLCLMHECKQTN